MTKRQAKIWNERVKLTAAYVNAAAIAVFIFAIVRPYFDAASPTVLAGLSLSAIIHLFALSVLALLKDEEAA